MFYSDDQILSTPSQFCSKFTNRGNNWQLFSDDDRMWLMTLLLIGLIVYFSIPIAYVIYHRNRAEMKSRSPIMIVIGTTLLLLDALFNTVIFTVNTIQHIDLICYLGIVTTAIPMIGAILFYLMRMYRIYKFFYLYNNSLIKKAEVKDSLS